MELAINIEKNTLRQPILITDNNVIISGHRRVKAYQLLSYPRIMATVQHYDNSEDEIEDLILINHARVKSREQMAREAAMLEEVEKQRADIRRLSYLKQNLTVPPVSAERTDKKDKGETRDKLAEKVGFKSGHEAERAIKTVKKIDELKKKGDSDSKDKADLLTATLNKHSVSTAAELAKYIDKVQIPEADRPSIIEGKKSPYSYVEEAKKQEQDNPSSIVS